MDVASDYMLGTVYLACDYVVSSGYCEYVTGDDAG